MVVANVNGFFYKDANTANLELLEELKAYDGKTVFLPMAIVNPTYPAWEKDARDMIDAGFVGFEMAPIYHGYSLAPEMLYDEYNAKHRAKWVIDLAEELDVPVRICSGFENFRGRSDLDTPKNIKGDDYFALLSKYDDVTVLAPITYKANVNGKFYYATLAEAIEAAGVIAVKNQDELFETCDIVSLHIPATPETKQSINYDLVGKMKEGGILVNTARKEVIDEEGLIKLMEERKDLKYLTDIKPDADAEFAEKFAGRYFATPKKMGAQTAEANVNAGIAAANQIVGFLRDGITKFKVN